MVVVGQTPPPFGGQAKSIEMLVKTPFEGVEISHVRMAFSGEMSDVGKPQPRKLLHLIALISRVLLSRLRARADVLYYPPAGPRLVPVLRDLTLLAATRWAFPLTAFHFSAAGLSELWPRLPRPLRPLFRIAYGEPDLAVQTSHLNPPDGRFLGAARTIVVPNGVPEHPIAREPRGVRSGAPVLLYAGALQESKGLLVLVEACRRLSVRGLDFRLHLMGSFESVAFEAELRESIRAAGLDGRVSFLGVLTGDAQAAAYRASDLFCYPTHYEAESFGRVVVEAMQFSLPVVATRWRGVPSVVEEGQSGLLVPVHDPAALADALQRVLGDADLARRLGKRGREVYLEHFTVERWRQRMNAALLSLKARQEELAAPVGSRTP